MGHKKVCLDCRKAFNQPMNTKKVHISICPQCKKPMAELYHLFQPPKQTDTKKWDVVKFLVDNGFRYYHIWEQTLRDENGRVYGYQNYAKYPESMKGAKEFVKLYKDQVITE